ncbi:MAG: polysaccharide biosynthesis/export family protein [Bacteroidales bacterium]|nr:polysaccharide biosynthesis/export family protein [Bacteroidales bacterium]
MKKILILLSCCLLVFSCKTSEKINYIQDVNPEEKMTVENFNAIRIQPRDIISIIVSSRNPELSKMFNLPVVTYQAGTEFSESGSSQRLIGYVVNENGEIDFPILGLLKIEGLTRWELSEFIKKKIVESNYIKDPIVSVEFVNFKVAVLGEVTSPGSFSIDSDKLTILDALSLARDLTIYGRRDRVFVIREQNGERTVYQMDLRSVDFFKSPAYYLKQNDVVYVEPNSVRAGQSTINENNVKSVSLWVSIGSFLATLATLLINVIR